MDMIHLLATRNHAVVHADLKSVQLNRYCEIRCNRRGRTVYLHHAAMDTSTDWIRLKQSKLENCDDLSNVLM